MLALQRSELDNAYERKAQLETKKAEALHRKVWHTMAASSGQGVAMANRIIHPIPAAPNGTAIADLTRVCHCGMVEPISHLKRCKGCKGPAGAGKILRIQAISKVHSRPPRRPKARKTNVVSGEDLL